MADIPSTKPSPTHPLGVICAMPDEIQHLAADLSSAAVEGHGGLRFMNGVLEGRSVVLVESGIGKVNAAMVATLLADRFACRALLVSGAAGGIDPALGIGDVVIAERLIQHDYGTATPGGFRPFRPGDVPLGEPTRAIDYRIDPAVRAVIARALEGFRPDFRLAGAAGSRRPVWRFGTVVSGDAFVNDEAMRRRLLAEFGAQAVEMEGAAVAQVAERYGVPCVVVRCLSDLAGADSHLDIVSFLGAAAREAADVVRRLVPVL
ncbi:MAG: 5'-methylthioadenosine/adenosylhomocysteine nucleosidase [Rhodospirillaceae bacterium]|nr:5'-methylthioadenosine/adenosylhomocysteine nucleosidase [Rhodospirillaceae bacterium]